MLIFRYLSKEVIYTAIAVTTIVVFIFLCNQFVRYMDYIATGKYAANMLFQLIALEIPVLVNLLLPLGLFLGILLAYGRLYADSEMTVMFACGIGHKQLMHITIGFSLIIVVIITALSIWISPIVAKQRDAVMDEAASATLLQTILPGRFQTSMNGRRVFYVEKMSRDRKKMKHVFIAEQSYPKSDKQNSNMPKWSILSAQEGNETVDAKTGAHYMVATNGYRYQGIAGQKDYEIMQYHQYGILLGKPKITGQNEGIEIISTKKLLAIARKNPAAMAELQWRISIPLMAFILVILAVPLSRVKPRKGRFAQLIPAILIFMVYANLLFVSRDWLENGTIPAWIGLWWIHLVMFILGLWLYARFTGWRLFKT